MKHDKHEGASEQAYFASPKDAVSKIAEMLRQSNFKTLAGYYDLTGSGLLIADLESGDFFVRKERPESAHPAGFWRYKHPFSPGFEYSNMWPAEKQNVHVIQVMTSIDQGSDSPAQVGYSQFYMIQSTHGWQVLPGRVEEGGEPTVIEP